MALTPAEFAKKLDRAIKNLETKNTPFREAVQSTHAIRMGRIFNEGRSRDGLLIGKYSTKPIYINPKKVGFSFTPKGKTVGEVRSRVASVRTRREKFVTTQRGTFAGRKVKERKTRYFATGYKGFRQFIGRPTKYVDLGLTYDMRFDIANSSNPNKPGMPDKISNNEYHERFKREHNAEKAAGAFKRFKKNIFGFSAAERKEFVRVLNFELVKLLQ